MADSLEGTRKASEAACNLSRDLVSKYNTSGNQFRGVLWKSFVFDGGVQPGSECWRLMALLVYWSSALSRVVA